MLYTQEKSYSVVLYPYLLASLESPDSSKRESRQNRDGRVIVLKLVTVFRHLNELLQEYTTLTHVLNAADLARHPVAHFVESLDERVEVSAVGFVLRGVGVPSEHNQLVDVYGS